MKHYLLLFLLFSSFTAQLSFAETLFATSSRLLFKHVTKEDIAKLESKGKLDLNEIQYGGEFESAAESTNNTGDLIPGVSLVYEKSDPSRPVGSWTVRSEVIRDTENKEKGYLEAYINFLPSAQDKGYGTETLATLSKEVARRYLNTRIVLSIDERETEFIFGGIMAEVSTANPRSMKAHVSAGFHSYEVSDENSSIYFYYPPRSKQDPAIQLQEAKFLQGNSFQEAAFDLYFSVNEKTNFNTDFEKFKFNLGGEMFDIISWAQKNPELGYSYIDTTIVRNSYLREAFDSTLSKRLVDTSGIWTTGMQENFSFLLSLALHVTQGDPERLGKIYSPLQQNVWDFPSDEDFERISTSGRQVTHLEHLGQLLHKKQKRSFRSYFESEISQEPKLARSMTDALESKRQKYLREDRTPFCRESTQSNYSKAKQYHDMRSFLLQAYCKTLD